MLKDKLIKGLLAEELRQKEMTSQKPLIDDSICVIKDVKAVEIKTIKLKFVNQITRWKYDKVIDKQFVSVLGYVRDISSNQVWNMVIFQYHKKLYMIDDISFFSLMGYDTKSDPKYLEEFNNFPQLFAD